MTLKDTPGVAEVLHTKEGKILVVGTVVNPKWQFAAHCFNANGSPDEAFGTAGLADEELVTPGSSQARAAALQSDGKLIIAGTVSSSTNVDLALIRLDTLGVLDPAFGDKGKVIVDAGLVSEQWTAVALSSAGKIVAVGGGSQGNQVVLGRFHDDGKPDETFADKGLAKPVLNVAARVLLDSVALQADGKTLAAGYCRNPSGLVVARFMEDGSLDPSFANAGMLFQETPEETVAYGYWVRGPELFVLSDGSILVAASRKESFQESMLLLQLSPDGGLSGMRTAGGRGSWNTFGATLLSNGSVLSVGRGFSEEGGTDYSLVRFTR